MTDRIPVVSVIIPHFNQPDQLASCLSLLLDPVLQVSGEVIVVDNGSHTYPDQVAKEFPDVRFLLQKEPGPGPARNLGVENANSATFAFIDADCRPADDWIATILAEMAERPGILGGEVRIGLTDSARPTIWECYESEYGFRMDKYVARDGFSGAGNLAVPREIFEKVGPFAGIGVAEDRDWGLRARELGYPTRYVADMVVYHPARKSWSEVARKWDRQTGHQYTEFAARRFGRLKWAARTLAMLVSPLVEAPKIALSKRIPGGLKGKLLCLAALIRVRLYRFWLMTVVLVTGDPDRLANRWRNG